MRRDTKTRYQGVFARHREGCGVERLGKEPTLTEIAKACTCKPAYWGGVWDRATGKKRKTSMCPSIAEAHNARADLRASLREGVLPTSTNTRIKPLADRFVKAMEDKVALNKRRRPYKQSAVRDIEGALRLYIVPRFGARRPIDVRRRDVQELVDEISPALSGSRIRTIVNSIHSFYAWAQDREIVEHDPADRVRLPAMDAQPRDRVVTPAQMTVLLNALVLMPDPVHGVIDPMRDVLPFALAAYATARRAEVRYARVEDIDLEAEAIYLGVDDNGRKSRAAQRVVPVVKPLKAIIQRSLLARGRPDGGELLCPGMKPGGRNSGLLSIEALQARANERWEPTDESGKPIPGKKVADRITLHECRHTCITWLDDAGVRPVVVSNIAGHSVRLPRDGAAEITQARYTHVLPGDIKRALSLFDDYLTEAALHAVG